MGIPHKGARDQPGTQAGWPCGRSVIGAGYRSGTVFHKGLCADRAGAKCLVSFQERSASAQRQLQTTLCLRILFACSTGQQHNAAKESLNITTTNSHYTLFGNACRVQQP